MKLAKIKYAGKIRIKNEFEVPMIDRKLIEKNFSNFKKGEEIYHLLMPYRVKTILFVSTYYDAYIFEQDGLLSEQIEGQLHALNISMMPRIIYVSDWEAALDKLNHHEVDLFISTMRIGEIGPFTMSKKIKELYPHLPFLLLLNDKSDVEIYQKNRNKAKYIDNAFLWAGNSNIFLAMIKYIEDKMNLENDTEIGLVRVILLVEDSVYFYSKYLPLLYSEVLKQTEDLVSQELNSLQRKNRRRLRPKIILTHSFEEAYEVCRNFKDVLFCVISDVDFPLHINDQDYKSNQAGITLMQKLKEENYNAQLVLQSSDKNYEKWAGENNIQFIEKNYDLLYDRMSSFVHESLGFGPFIFRDEEDKEYGRAHTIPEFLHILQTLPENSLYYHSKNNHFSAWLIARGEIRIAKTLQPLRVEHFKNLSHMRDYLLKMFTLSLKRRYSGRIIDFAPEVLTYENSVVKLATGSFGGKGRGLAFINSLLSLLNYESKYKSTKIKIPKTSIIGVDEYNQFLKNNTILKFLNFNKINDKKVKEIFLKGNLSQTLISKLKQLLEIYKKPLAIRSSGTLEDTISQPFAGIYDTYMLPNNQSDEQRLRCLENAIKLVWASAFCSQAVNYVNRINVKIEDQRMAVIIQELVGNEHNGRFYPIIAGVAQSYDFYPSGTKPEDGVSHICLGLGHWIVRGNNSFRFCPNHPGLSVGQNDEIRKNTQVKFYAIDLKNNSVDLLKGETATMGEYSLDDAMEDGTLSHIASTYDIYDNRLKDGIGYKGPKILTFANVLKYDYIPFAKIIADILELGQFSFGMPVEIEYAVTLDSNKEKEIYPTVYILQIRALALEAMINFEQPRPMDSASMALYTNVSLGNGVIDNISDLVIVNPETFETGKTLEMVKEIQEINEGFISERKQYILVGPGRWGSRDRFIGIPVQWADISNAKVICEVNYPQLEVEASQGSHFFHNLVSMNVGYLHISSNNENQFFDREWFCSHQLVKKTKYFYHLKNKNNFVVKMFGRFGIAYILK